MKNSKLLVSLAILTTVLLGGCGQADTFSPSTAGSGSTTPSSSGASSTTDLSTGTDSSTTWSKTAGSTYGSDWQIMNTAQKLDLINGVIMSWNNAGLPVNGDANYFLNALNSFYTGENSGSTQTTSVAQAISLMNATSSSGSSDSQSTSLDGMTLANFNLIDSSYTVSEVNNLFGIKGKLSQETGQGTNYDLTTYTWEDPNSFAIVTVMFQNGQETAKDQVGLN